MVDATVRTVDAIIRGQYTGTLVASGTVEITATGRVSGTLRTNSLVIAKGGAFRGSVTQLEERGAERTPRAVARIDEARAASRERARSRSGPDVRRWPSPTPP